MKLADEVKYRKIEAGGPGSGRRSEGGHHPWASSLKKVGFKWQRTHIKSAQLGSRIDEHYKHPSGAKVTLHEHTGEGLATPAHYAMGGNRTYHDKAGLESFLRGQNFK